MQDQSYKKDNNALADKIRKEELLLSIALSEYKQVIFDILTPIVEGAKITLTPIKEMLKINRSITGSRKAACLDCIM